MDHRRQQILLFFFVLLNVIIGLRIVPHYGLSWDEAKHIEYGRAALSAYQGEKDYLSIGRDRKYYGPAYWMIAAGIEPLFRFVFPSWHRADAWHFTSWIAFQVSVVAFFALASRLMTGWTALWMSLFYATQPLLWGHAFINQLDIPFMSFFMILVALGLRAADRFVGERGSIPRIPCERIGLSSLRRYISSHRGRFLLGLSLLAVSVATAVDLLLLNRFVLGALQASVRALYAGEGLRLLQAIFHRLATDAHKTPLSTYLERVHTAYLTARYCLLAILAGIGLLSGWRLVWRDLYPRQSQRACDVFMLLLAGIVLGLTISIRVAGPFAGLLVSAYALMRYGSKSASFFAIYWPIALLTSYATWPFLWGAPIARYVESLRNAGAYTQMYVYYLAEKRLSSALPWHYLPVLMVIQWTEPILLLLPVGAVSVFRRLKVGARERKLILIILLLWFLLPVTAVLLGMPIYDNFRHILFAMPPLFLISGIGLERIRQIIQGSWVNVLFPILILLPGGMRIVELHPYEYTHYNLLVGGVSGAQGRFETDYWCTSLRQAMEHVNAVAVENAVVRIAGPSQAAAPFARRDLNITKDSSDQAPDYAIACRWNLFDQDFFPGYRTLLEIGRGEAVFARVKSRW